MSYGSGKDGFPSDASPQGRGGMPGGKKAGGGIFTLLIIGAVLFFMFGGLGQGANNQGQPEEPRQGGGFDEGNWRPDQGEQKNADRNDQFDFRGDRNAKKKPQNDRVENDEGWSMEDVDAKKKKNQFNFSDQKQEPASDAVKKDGWEIKDANDKKGGNRFPLSNESKAKSDAVKKDGWEVKDATGKGSGKNK